MSSSSDGAQCASRLVPFFSVIPPTSPWDRIRNTYQCHQTSSIDRRSSIDLRPKFSIEPLIVRFVPRVRACERCRLTAYIRSPAYDLLLNGVLLGPIEEPSLCSDEKHLRDFRHNGRSNFETFCSRSPDYLFNFRYVCAEGVQRWRSLPLIGT